MRALVQRAASGSVDALIACGADFGEGSEAGARRWETVGEIGAGVVVLVGVTHDDDAVSAVKLADKIANLRIFDDDAGVMNRSLLDVGGQALVISQFTLYGETSRGRRPSWIAAARPEVAEPLVDAVVTRLRDAGIVVATGRFRHEMRVSIVNDGPVTLMLDV